MERNDLWETENLHITIPVVCFPHMIYLKIKGNHLQHHKMFKTPNYEMIKKFSEMKRHVINKVTPFTYRENDHVQMLTFEKFNHEQFSYENKKLIQSKNSLASRIVISFFAHYKRLIEYMKGVRRRW